MDQHDRAGAPLRWARACALATAIVIVSMLAHTSAGGGMPPWWLMLGLTAATTTALAGLLARPAGPVRVAALLAGGQALLHVAMTAVAGHGIPASGAHEHASVGAAGHHAEAPGSLVQTWLAHLQQDLSAPNLAMAAAHLAAAAALGWWLASGERAVWSLMHLLVTHPGTIRVLARALTAVRLVLVGAPTPRRGPRHRHAFWCDDARVSAGVQLASVVVRRGPPGWCGA